MQAILDFLRATELFSSLDAPALERLASRCTVSELRRGETLDPTSPAQAALLVVVSGRLSLWSGRRKLQALRPGQSLGGATLFPSGHEDRRVLAERDSTVIRLGREHFEEAFRDHPHQLLPIVLRLLDREVHHTPHSEQPRRPPRSIAIVALVDHPEVARFCLALQDELHQRHSAALFPPSDVVPEATWFDQQEARYETVLFQCRSTLDPWTQRCLRQADRLLVLGLAKHPTPPSPAERYWADLSTPSSRSLLVLLGSGKRRGTSRWLKGRPAMGVHHLDWGHPPRRIARFLDGTAIGLVLGGGGARGLAHVGVLKALEEKGIEVDLVCGTSMGGFVAALHASGRSARRVESDLRWAWLEAGPFLDFTFPLYSVIKGQRMTERLRRLFGSASIEDLPKPFFCMTADITHARSLTHDRGPLVQWLAVGMSVPGVAPPFPYQGSLLLDGGLLNNLPIDVAASFDCGQLIAINVDPKDEMAINMRDFEGSLASQLWRKLRGQTTAPHLFEILVRVTTLSNAASVSRLRSSVDHYIQPETGRYGLFDFHLADQIIQAGYDAAQAYPFPQSSIAP